MFLTEEGLIQSKQPETYQIVSKKHRKNPKNRPKKKHPIIRGIFKTILVALLIIILLVLILGGFAIYKLYEVVKDVKITRSDLVIKHENSVIRDIKGNELGTLNGDENRVIITLEDMPEYLPKAFISIEDERFYEHKGVDIKRRLHF